MQQTVDLVEELELNDTGTDIEREYLKFVANEWDQQALAEALLLKQAAGARVTVVGFQEIDVDPTLYRALAQGADRAVKLNGDFERGMSSHQRATVLAAWLGGEPFDLVLIGVQSPEDLDGQTGAILAGLLGLAHASVVVAVEAGADGVTVRQEHGGGVVHELALAGRAVIGVQAAREAPPYVSVSRIQAAMKEGGLEIVGAPAVGASRGAEVRRLYAPKSSAHAEMLGDDADAVAARILEIVRERRIVKELS
jgi:electron transfer flavoprotein beta subunit